jgi:nucleotide-binding universal stress UspA family protein
MWAFPDVAGQSDAYLVDMEPVRAFEATIEDAPRAAIGVQGARHLRLLVGYDGQAGSRDALALAKAFCETGVTELTVASVRPYWPALVGVENLAMVVKEDEQWIRRGATKVLGTIPFSARAVPGGHETAGLKELAEAEESDMIVVGSTHRGRMGRVCPGSVGERVLDGAPCAVAIAPHGLANGDASIHEIAVGYDGSRASTVALRRAIGLAERCHASLVVLGAVEISLGLAGYETRQPKDLQQAEMEHHLERALEMVPSMIAAQSRLLFGAPARAIVDAAKGADLLVLGSRGSYSAIRHLALGTVGTAAMRCATCPTLITPTDS